MLFHSYHLNHISPHLPDSRWQRCCPGRPCCPGRRCCRAAGCRDHRWCPVLAAGEELLAGTVGHGCAGAKEGRTESTKPHIHETTETTFTLDNHFWSLPHSANNQDSNHVGYNSSRRSPFFVQWVARLFNELFLLTGGSMQTMGRLWWEELGSSTCTSRPHAVCSFKR